MAVRTITAKHGTRSASTAKSRGQCPPYAAAVIMLRLLTNEQRMRVDDRSSIVQVL